MNGRSSQRRGLRILGAVAAGVGLVGAAAVGWEFGGTDATVPTVLGFAFAALAVAVTLYDRFA